MGVLPYAIDVIVESILHIIELGIARVLLWLLICG
jgi:hypothetical protein